MELLNENAEYRDIVLAAKTLGINYVAVEKGVLRERVNEMIMKINNGEIENPATESLEENNKENSDITSDDNENTDDENSSDENESKAREAAKKAAEKAKRERPTRSSSKKWYEEEGAFPYKAGDVVEIIGGKDLIGRKLQVFEPSAKKDMVKGRLLHPITGNLQNTMISIAFERIQLLENNDSQVEDQTKEVTNEENPVTNEQVENPAQEDQLEEVTDKEVVNPDQEDQLEEITDEEVVNKEEVENTDEESIIAGSEEVIDIPENDSEESDEEKLKAE